MSISTNAMMSDRLLEYMSDDSNPSSNDGDLEIDFDEDDEDLPLVGHLRLAAEYGDLNRVKSIIENEHADVNGCDIPEWSVLISAAWRGQFAIVKYLISRGANVGFRSEVS